MQAWMLLLSAIVLEVAGTTAMKLSAGFSHLLPSILIFVFYLASFTCLTYTLHDLDVSLAYAVWAGLGTALVALIGVWYFGEPLSLLKMVCLGLIILGVAGLNLAGSAHTAE